MYITLTKPLATLLTASAAIQTLPTLPPPTPTTSPSLSTLVTAIAPPTTRPPANPLIHDDPQDTEDPDIKDFWDHWKDCYAECNSHLWKPECQFPPGANHLATADTPWSMCVDRIMDCTSECHQKWFWRWDAEKTEEEMLLEMLLGDGGSD